MRDPASACEKLLEGVKVLGPNKCLDKPVNPKQPSFIGPQHCGCGAPMRMKTNMHNYRLVSCGITMLFVFCLLLFMWNILLWRQISELQSHVTNLEGTVRNHDYLIDRVRRRNSSERFARKRSRNRLVNEEDLQQPEETHDLADVVSTQNVQTFTDGTLAAVSPPDLDMAKSRSKRSSGENGQNAHEFSNPPRVRPRVRRGGKGKGPKRRGRRGAERIVRKRAVAIHVPVKANDPYPGIVIRDQIIHSWDPNPVMNQGFGVSHINAEAGDPGGVEVTTPGVYFVYSQIVFKMNKGSDITGKIMTGVIGNNELSACTNSFPSTHDAEDYISCYTSGITRLSRGDRIRVRISPAGIKVFMSPTHSYFGAFLIGT